MWLAAAAAFLDVFTGEARVRMAASAAWVLALLLGVAVAAVAAA